MRLSAKAITTFGTINALNFGNEWTVRAGDPNTLYFQLVDLDQDGLRYLAGVGGGNTPASVQVTFPALDDIQVLSIAATQDANDKSIWSVVLLPSQTPRSGNVQFAVTEGANVRRFNVLNLMSVEYPLSDGSC